MLPIRLGGSCRPPAPFARVALMALFSVTVVMYARSTASTGFAVGDLQPSGAGFAALVPVLLYNYLGFDAPSAAAGEMRDPQRDLPAAILRAGAWTFVLYAVPVLATLLVVPPDRITGLTGFVSAIREVFAVYGPAGDALGTMAGAAVRLGAADEWRHVADGERTQPGGRVPRRRRPAPARRVLHAARRHGSRSCRASSRAASRWRRSRRRVQRRALLRGRAVAVDRGDRALVRRDLRGAGPAPADQQPARRPAVPRPRRDVRPSACSALSLGWTMAALALLLWPPDLPEAFRTTAPRSSSRRSCRSCCWCRAGCVRVARAQGIRRRRPRRPHQGVRFSGPPSSRTR